MSETLERLRKLALREIEGEIPVFEYALAADELERLEINFALEHNDKIELEKERDLHKNSALDYLSLWNASVIDRDELKVAAETWHKRYLERCLSAHDSTNRYGIAMEAIEEELQILAAQNVAMRDIAQSIRCSDEEVYKAIRTILNLPNLAESILRKRDASTLRRAAEWFDEPEADSVGKIAASCLRTMAKEIEGEAK